MVYRPPISMPQRPKEDEALKLARKMLKASEKYSMPDTLSAAFGVLTHTLMKFSVDQEQALDNVDRLSADLKTKLTQLYSALPGPVDHLFEKPHGRPQ